MTNVCAVVFAFDEEQPIQKTLEILNKFKSEGRIQHIVVVDDGSTDGTVFYSKKAGAIVVSHSKNKGKREAFITGAKKAKELGAEIMLSLDADITQFPKRTLDEMVNQIKYLRKSMSVAQQYEGNYEKVTNPDANAQRAISMKALDPLFSGNPKWIDLFRTNTKEKGKSESNKWGLEYTLNQLIPKNKQVWLTSEVHTMPAFRKNQYSPSTLSISQIESDRLVNQKLLQRKKLAEKIKVIKKRAQNWRELRQKYLKKREAQKQRNRAQL